MLDTVRFKIKISSDLGEKIRQVSKETIYRDNLLGIINYRQVHSEINIPSYEKKLHVWTRSDDQHQNCVIECSLPKQKYGHNIWMVYPSEVKDILKHIRKRLVLAYGSFPEIYTWGIERLDLCYAWKFPSQVEAEGMLERLKSFQTARNLKTVYPTSIYIPGEVKTIKYYLKSNEFYAHDFKELKKTDHEKASNLHNMAQGVLRFEISLKKRALIDLVYKEYTPSFFMNYEYLQYDVLMDIIQKYHYKYIQLENTETMTADKVLKRLLKYHDLERARNIWQYYLITTSTNPQISRLMNSLFSRPTRWRYQKMLKNAKVGILQDNERIEFSLDIPSPYAVN